MRERESRTARDNFRTALKVAAGAALVFSGSMASRQDQVEGMEPARQDYSRLDFKPVVVDNQLNKESVDIEDRLTVVFPSPSATDSAKPARKPNLSAKMSKPDWILDPEISFYGPGFYGRRTACGLALTKDLEGVAHRTLPCGTMVTFNWEGMTHTFPVVDRGPYVAGRIFDLTGGACMAFKDDKHPKGHCFTGPINYRIEK